MLERKCNKDELELLSKTVEELQKTKADASKIENSNKLIKHALEEVSKDMAMKSNIKDVCKLLDLKANTK